MAFNTFLEDTAIVSPGFSLRIDFLRGGYNVLSVLFREGGIHGMLEASGRDSIYQVLHFHGAITDRLTGCPAVSVT